MRAPSMSGRAAHLSASASGDEVQHGALHVERQGDAALQQLILSLPRHALLHQDYIGSQGDKLVHLLLQALLLLRSCSQLDSSQRLALLGGSLGSHNEVALLHRYNSLPTSRQGGRQLLVKHDRVQQDHQSCSQQAHDTLMLERYSDRPHLLLGHALKGGQPALRTVELQVFGNHKDLGVHDVAAHAFVR